MIWCVISFLQKPYGGPYDLWYQKRPIFDHNCITNHHGRGGHAFYRATHT